VGKGVNGYSTDRRISPVHVYSSVYPLPHLLIPEFRSSFVAAPTTAAQWRGVLARRVLEGAGRQATSESLKRRRR